LDAVSQQTRVISEPPTVSIVTPSFEMAGFLRETIESVLAQDWPHVDYLVMDGGSRDGTRELLEGYGDRIRWVSRPDGGQAAAVNSGFADTRGSIFTFLNADDIYRPGALHTAVEGFDRRPDASVVYGDADFVDGDGRTVVPYPVRDFDRDLLIGECFICQPAAFVRREAWSDCGGLDASLRYALDYDFWIRLSERHRLVRIDGTLATSRMHSDNKTLGERGGLYRESIAVAKRHFGYVPMSWLEPYARYRVDHVDQFYELARAGAGAWHRTEPAPAPSLLARLAGRRSRGALRRRLDVEELSAALPRPSRGDTTGHRRPPLRARAPAPGPDGLRRRAPHRPDRRPRARRLRALPPDPGGAAWPRGRGQPPLGLDLAAGARRRRRTASLLPGLPGRVRVAEIDEPGPFHNMAR
jgi:hypothetical protein